MATPNERTLTDLVLVDNEPLNIKKLDLDGAYRQIVLTFILNLTNTATPPTLIEDGFFKYFTAVGIRRNSKTFKFNQPLQFAIKKQTADIGTPPFFVDADLTASATYDIIAQYTIHFAEDINNENDISALLQTGNLTNLELVVATGDIDDIFSADAPTINSRKIEIQIRDFTGKGRGGKNINDPREEKMTDIFELVEEFDLEVGKTSFTKLAQEIDMVSGSNILEHAGLVLDAGLLSDDRVTDVRTFNVVPRTSDLESTFKGLNRQTKTNYKLESTLKGFFKIDWQEKLGRAGFVTGVKSKELIQLLTNGVSAGNDKFLLYTKFV